MKTFVLVEDWKQHANPHCIGVFTSFKNLYAVMKKEFGAKDCPEEKELRKCIREKGFLIYTRAFTNHRISIWQRDTKTNFSSANP